MVVGLLMISAMTVAVLGDKVSPVTNGLSAATQLKVEGIFTTVVKSIAKALSAQITIF